METLAFPLLVAMQLTCMQQYRSGELIHVTIRPRLLGNHATRQYRVVSVSMEVFNYRLPSNDGIRPNTSQYVDVCTLEETHIWASTAYYGNGSTFLLTPRILNLMDKGMIRSSEHVRDVTE
jgi:hypothetical protein